MQDYPPGFFKKLRDRIASVIANYSANDVPSVCRRFGLADGTREEAFQGKFKYASARLFELSNDKVLNTARTIAQEEGDEELIALIESVEPKPSAPVTGFQIPKRAYYAERTGKDPTGGRLDLNALKSLYQTEWGRWEEEGYFQEHFGFWCVDQEFVKGTLGANIEAKMMFSLGKPNLWPVPDRICDYTEDDLFSVIEFMFDHISKPLAGTMHQYGQCGVHWHTFSGSAGQAEYRASVNALLARYRNGYELSSQGEVMEKGPEGTANLLTANLPVEERNIRGRVASAITKFRRRQSTADDRRDAVRDLADVMEYLRPQLRDVLTKADESDLFNIANNFSIRHHNHKQKTDYDPAVWLSWMFYFYLATIHAGVRLIEKNKT